MTVQRNEPVLDTKPKGAIFIVSLVGLLTLVLWGALFALNFIRG
jgi:hypothetical protein